MKKAVMLVLLAVLILIFGGMTRPYPAFGGEDMLALTLMGYAIYNVYSEYKKREV